MLLSWWVLVDLCHCRMNYLWWWQRSRRVPCDIRRNCLCRDWFGGRNPDHRRQRCGQMCLCWNGRVHRLSACGGTCRRDDGDVGHVSDVRHIVGDIVIADGIVGDRIIVVSIVAIVVVDVNPHPFIHHWRRADDDRRCGADRCRNNQSQTRARWCRYKHSLWSDRSKTDRHTYGYLGNSDIDIGRRWDE